MKVALLLILTAILYRPVLSAPFVYEDDNWLLELQPHARNASLLQNMPSRALTLQTYVWQADQQTGWANPTVFHAVNVGLHLLVGLLVYACARRFGVPPWGAWLALFVFLLHPLQTQAVAYVSARSDLLMTLCIVGALLCATSQRWWAVAGVLVCLALAVMSKEIAVVGGVLLLGTALWRRHDVLADILIVIGTFAFIAAVSRLLFILPASDPQEIAAQVAGLGRVIGLFVLPVGLTIDPDPVAVGTAGRLLAVVLISGLAMVAWLVRHRLPLVTCGLVWAGVALLPRVLVPNGEPVQEQHAYLAMVGLSLALGSLVAFLAASRNVPDVRPA